MRLITSYCLSVLVLLSQFCVLKAESIQIETRRDYEVLDHFLRMGILEEGYGYVLAGDKPISIRDFYSLDCFPIAKDLKISEREFLNTLLVREAIPVWKKLCSSQKNFILKAVPLNSSGSGEFGWEVQFINSFKLQEVIDKNIDLFRYVLGPTLTSEQLVNKIAYSEELFSDILLNDCVLIGIVLGFGSHNSVVGGREETIEALTISRDLAPFTPKSLAMQSKKKLSVLRPETFGGYYLELAGGDDTLISFKSDFTHLMPSSGFLDIEEELLAINAANESLPSCLMERKPAFIFGAYKGGPSNQPFFERLKRSQKYAKTLLKKTDFLEQVLEKIGGEKPRITCKKTDSSSLSLSFFRGSINTQTWKQIFDEVVNRFDDKERQLAFLESFSCPSCSSVAEPLMMGVSKATLEGLKKALCHLSDANDHFETLSKDASLQSIVPKQLYFKTTFESSGKKLKDSDRIRIGYVIEDPEGNILFANHDTWLSLSQTIPGFAHAIQGMRIGEKRQLFIHPSLAYGALTTLPPCIELVVKVQLLAIDEKSSGSLPSLTALDLSWIQNPALYSSIEESLRQQPRFIGSFYHNLLDKIEGSNKTAIIEELCHARVPKETSLKEGLKASM